MRAGTRRLSRVGILALLVSILLAGCGSKITQENFDKIQPGMSQDEVKAILGDPAESSGVSVGPISGGTWIWKARDATITIQFLSGKVFAKQFARKAS